MQGQELKGKKYLSHHLTNKSGSGRYAWESGVDLEVRTDGRRGCKEHWWRQGELESGKHQHLKGKRAGEWSTSRWKKLCIHIFPFQSILLISGWFFAEESLLRECINMVIAFCRNCSWLWRWGKGDWNANLRLKVNVADLHLWIRYLQKTVSRGVFSPLVNFAYHLANDVI